MFCFQGGKLKDKNSWNSETGDNGVVAGSIKVIEVEMPA
jgi:hypothetical protein